LRSVTLGDFFGRYRQHALAQLPSQIDFIATGDGLSAQHRLLMDEEMLERALDNLLKNAREALGDRTGRIHLEWLVGPEPRKELIAVSDDGPGMTSEALAASMETSRTTKRSIGGTGLGLKSVRRAVELHGGRMSIDSEPQRGTRV